VAETVTLLGLVISRRSQKEGLIMSKSWAQLSYDYFEVFYDELSVIDIGIGIYKRCSILETDAIFLAPDGHIAITGCGGLYIPVRKITREEVKKLIEGVISE
jgi:hypothetical protein